MQEKWLVIGANEQAPTARLASQEESDAGSDSLNKVAPSKSPGLAIPHQPRPSKEKTWAPEPVLLTPTQPAIEQDWVVPDIMPQQESFMDVINSRDWSLTPLGKMKTWPPRLRQEFNQILADSRPVAIYWGKQHTTIYNEAFSKLVGSKHPGLLGMSVDAAWPDTGTRMKEIMHISALKRRASSKQHPDLCFLSRPKLFLQRAASLMRQPNHHTTSVPKKRLLTPKNEVEDEWRFFMEKTDGRLQETYLKWSIVPISDDDKVLGFIYPVLDTTSMRLWERRMKMLIDLGEALVTARDKKSYWAKVIEQLEAVRPSYDIPLAILYSVHDDPDATDDSQSPHESNKLCQFEGALGVPEGHPIISPIISLRSSDDGLAPMFRDAIRGRHPLLLQSEDGSLPESLIQGLEWRGFGDPCQKVVICPIQPTRDENVMGLLFLGLNPRRPYDNDYRQHISLLSQKLTSSLASTVLLEEETRRRRNAAEQAAYDQAMLQEKLAAQTREATEYMMKFEAVADFIPVGMAFGEFQGSLTFANDAWHRITGKPQKKDSSMVHMDEFLSFVIEKDRPAVTQAYEKLTTQESVTFEFQLTREDSDHSPPPPKRSSTSFERAGIDLMGIENNVVDRHILASARAERAADGRILQVLTCLTDVTLHKQTADEAVRRAQQAENLKRMAEFATVGMYEMGLDGMLKDANKVFYEMCGLDKATLHQAKVKPWEMCVADEDIDRLHDVVSKVSREGTPQTVEVRFKTPWMFVDSQGMDIVAPRWAHGSFMPVKNLEGTMISICGCVSDISLQKWQLEQERVRKEEALESKRQQENFIDMTSHEMRNPLSAIIHCADAVIASLTKALDLYQARKSVPATEGNGSAITTTREASNESLMENSIENAETIIACAQHQKRIVDDILTMSKLDSKLLAVTPITVNPLQIVQEALKMFEVEARRVDIDLTMIISPSYKKLGVDFLDLDPSRLKQVLINLLTNALKFTKSVPTRKVSITISASRERPSDGTSSVQFIPRFKDEEDLIPPPHVEDDGTIFLSFEVKDTGQGLTEEEMKSLFQRFKQASARTHVKYGGSGLGLFISRRLTEMHNGAIGVASLPGVGSTFAFYVEAHRPSEDALLEARLAAATAMKARRVNSSNIAQRAVNLHLSPSDARLSGMPVRDGSPIPTAGGRAVDPMANIPKINGILVVEDNLINQQITRKGLADRGYTVDVANHGLEALEKLRASDRWVRDGTALDHQLPDPAVGFGFSLILMDVEMPIQDGLTCTRQIRELEREGKILGPHVPIIAVSANARLEQVLEAKAAGCDDVLVKPYRMPELVEKMNVVMLQVEAANRERTSGGDNSEAEEDGVVMSA